MTFNKWLLTKAAAPPPTPITPPQGGWPLRVANANTTLAFGIPTTLQHAATTATHFEMDIVLAIHILKILSICINIHAYALYNTFFRCTHHYVFTPVYLIRWGSKSTFKRITTATASINSSTSSKEKDSPTFCHFFQYHDNKLIISGSKNVDWDFSQLFFSTISKAQLQLSDCYN